MPLPSLQPADTQARSALRAEEHDAKIWLAYYNQHGAPPPPGEGGHGAWKTLGDIADFMEAAGTGFNAYKVGEMASASKGQEGWVNKRKEEIKHQEGHRLFPNLLRKEMIEKELRAGEQGLRPDLGIDDSLLVGSGNSRTQRPNQRLDDFLPAGFGNSRTGRPGQPYAENSNTHGYRQQTVQQQQYLPNTSIHAPQQTMQQQQFLPHMSAQVPQQSSGGPEAQRPQHHDQSGYGISTRAQYNAQHPQDHYQSGDELSTRAQYHAQHPEDHYQSGNAISTRAQYNAQQNAAR